MEDHLTTTFTADAGLAAFFAPRTPDAWWFTSQSLGIGAAPAVPVKPFVVWNELQTSVFDEVQETSNAHQRTFTLWVYDERGDFTKINQIMKELRRIAKGMAPFVTGSGVRCSQSVWAGMSGQLPADGYDAGCRFGTVRFVVSE